MFGSMDIIDAGRAYSEDRSEGFLRLGTRHLTENGLCHQWLLRQAADAHISGLAYNLECFSRRFTDTQGRAVRPVFVSGSIEGTASSFHEGDVVFVQQSETPRPGNGFTSAFKISSEAGSRVLVRLTSRFARWGGASNADLVRATVAGEEAIAPGPGAAFDQPALSVSGLDEIETSSFSVRICPETHLNCYGLVSFSAFATCFSQSERASANIPADGAAILSRNLLCRGNLDPGDYLDISSIARPSAVRKVAGLVSKSWARRRSDGRIIAASLSVRQPC